MTLRTLLYVDDDPDNLATLRRVLRGHYEVQIAGSGAEALALLEKTSFPVVIADQRMPGMSGVEFLKKGAAPGSSRVGILLTAYSDLDALVDGVNAGVIYRYLTKPWREADLLHAILQAFEKQDLTRERDGLLIELQRANRYLRDEIGERYDTPPEGWTDAGLANVGALISKVASTASAVLIRGESGAGKETAARAIHAAGPRKDKTFVRLNCALPEASLEIELFGSERKPGRLEAADGGTLFLDEVGGISPKLQAGLFRVLQERTFERVGGNETLRADIRIIAASRRNLEKMMRDGTFREDLYYKLNVFPIHVPPLRERLQALPALCRRILDRARGNVGGSLKPVSLEAMRKLESYDWPGNVRELENVLERALILAGGEEILPDDLALGPSIDESAFSASELSREQILEAVTSCGGNKVEAARKLGIKRPTLYYHLKRLGIS